MDKTAHDIIIRPILTEASMADIALKKYTFKVLKTANKYEIAKAVEELFGVKVAKVNTMVVGGKAKRMAAARVTPPTGKRLLLHLQLTLRALSSLRA